MAASNHERIGTVLDLLKQGLTPIVERELKAAYKNDWQEMAKQDIRSDRDLKVTKGQIQWDAHLLLSVMWNHWNNVYKNTLGNAERSLVSELKEARNQWAHQKSFSTDDAYRVIDSAARLLTAISAKEAQDVEQMKQELLRIRFDEQARRQTKSAAVAPTAGQPMAGLKPWREVVMPHPDVASGRYQQAEFAADLAQVFRGQGADEYRDPEEFFRRTFLTDGLKSLLGDGLLRLSGKGGNPVIKLQTNFGGGKTHSMLALLHMFSGAPASKLTGVDAVMQQASINALPKANVAVLVGTALSAGMTYPKKKGVIVHTLWGEMAWQLLKEEGYEIVAEADKKGVSPGSDALRELFTKASPCLILIDEWVAYVRQTYGKYDLPGGSFDANLTFAQSLTEAAKNSPKTFLVASIPWSQIEIGGEAGKEALALLENTFRRIESPWRPASPEESFEIVRRRLFQPVTDSQKHVERDAVARAFSELYRGDQATEFPQGCGEAEYERRIKAAYPIHPELFDRLFNDWSTLDKFQRTRGVLRLMAAVIHSLWERQDASLLILPSMVPIDDGNIQKELLNYVEDNWAPVIEKDVDGPHSLPLKLDRENPANLGRYSACRRVARTIYMGSAPTQQSANKGIEDRQIKLGCAQPGENVAPFGDALRRLTDQATHLYVDGRRYWYSIQPSVTRLAQDRSAQQDIHIVWEELEKRIRANRSRGDFAAVHAVPQSSGDVPDDMEARLVILGPEYPHARQTSDSKARTKCDEILNQRGTSPRLYRNMLVFLAPDTSRLNDLEAAIRQYLAWESISRDREALNLDVFQSKQVSTKRTQADEVVTTRIQEAYIWVLVPRQEPQGLTQWEEIRLQGSDDLAARASRKLKGEEHLILQFSATRLCLELERYLWKDVEHLSIKKLWEYFATYLYLPRLKDSNVLLEAIRDGVSKITWSDHFAYAEGWDDKQSKYLGLRAGHVGTIVMDSQSIIVKPGSANRQLSAEADKRQSLKGDEIRDAQGLGGSKKIVEADQISDTTIQKSEDKKPTRFHGSVHLDPLRIGRDASKVAEEIVQHLTGLSGASVQINMEIHAKIPDGAPSNIVRTVTENCKTLKFETQGFEEE